MDFGTILPVVTLLIGWSLNEFGNLYRDRKERRKILGVAISDMLEIRDGMISNETALKLLGERLDLESNIQAVVKRIFEASAPSQDDLQERYEKTLSLIASNDPVLSFRLRSKYSFRPILTSLRGIVESEKLDSSYMMSTEIMLIQKIVPQFDQLILELASRHSRRTLAEVRKYLNSKPAIVPPLLAQIFSSIQPKVQGKE